MTARRVILCILLIPITLFALWIGVYFLKMSDSPRPEITAKPADYVTGPARWVQDLSDAASPRTPHPSMRTLEAFVAERVAAAVNEVGDDVGGRVRVSGDEPAAAQVEAVRQRLNRAAGGAGAGAGSGDEQPEVELDADPGRTSVGLSWREFREVSVPWWPTPVRRGTLRADVSGPRGTATVVAELDEKPWLETEPATVGRNGYVVVSTQMPAATAEIAEATARRATIDTLVMYLEARVRSMHGVSNVAREDLRRQAEWALADGRVLDRALVRVDRPYGPVWYAADLVDTRVVDPLAAAAARSQVRRTRTVAATVIALPGMLLVLGAVYLGLNALTRGYFRSHLRAAMAAAVAVGVVVLLLVAGFLG